MTTQNIQQVRYSFANIAAAGSPYYYPGTAGITADGFDHIDIRARLVSGNVANFVTMTVWADDGSGGWLWDESLGMYDWMTNARGTATWVANNSTVNCRLHAENHNARLWRVRLVIVDGGQPANNSGIIEFRLVKE